MVDANSFANPTYDKHLKMADVSNIPYFFGGCIFAFEGNPMTLEVYH